jgi:hypothetical protein
MTWRAISTSPHLMAMTAAMSTAGAAARGRSASLLEAIAWTDSGNNSPDITDDRSKALVLVSPHQATALAAAAGVDAEDAEDYFKAELDDAKLAAEAAEAAAAEAQEVGQTRCYSRRHNFTRILVLATPSTTSAPSFHVLAMPST